MKNVSLVMAALAGFVFGVALMAAVWQKDRTQLRADANWALTQFAYSIVDLKERLDECEKDKR